MKKLLLISIFLAFVASMNAQTITAGLNGAQLRNAINAKHTALSDSLAFMADSIVAHTTSIQLRLLKSDTTSMLANYARNGELNTALSAYLAKTDTATMLEPYALTSELGDAGTSISDVQDEIADSLNALRPLYVAVADTASMLDPYAKLSDLTDGGISLGAVQEEIADSLNAFRVINVVGDGTVGPFFDGTEDGGQILYFYGDNGFWTALQGGAPTANRIYRLPIAALPSAGTTSLLNIDEYGNMGFVASTSKLSVSDTATMLTPYALTSELGDAGLTEAEVSGIVHDSIADLINGGTELSDVAVMIADSTGNAPGNYVTRKALADSIAANIGGATGFIPNGGTLTLDGDDITFTSSEDGSYALPAGGGNLTIMSQVQGWISDSLDKAIMIVDSTGTSPGNYVTRKALVDSIAAAGIGTGVSMVDVQNEIADSLNAIRSASIAGIALEDSTGYAPGNYVTHTQLDAFSGGSWDSTYIHYRVDSLVTVIDGLNTQISNLWNALEALGDFDLSAPAFLSAELGSFSDSIVVVLMDTTDVRQDSVPLTSAFTLWAGATQHGIEAVDISYDTLFIALDSAGVYGTVYTLDYTKGYPALQDSTGNETSSWTARSVTNSFGEPIGMDSDVETYISGLATPLSTEYTEALNTFVVSLKDSLNISSLSSVFDAMWIMDNETSEAAVRNLVERDNDMTIVAGMTFTQYLGFNGNGTTQYLNTNFVPSTDGVNYTLNNASFGIYSRTNVSESSIDMGCIDDMTGYGDCEIGIRVAGLSDRCAGKLNTESDTYVGFTGNTSSIGMFMVTRNGSAYTDLTLYIDKTANTTRGGTGSTNSLSPNAVFIGAFNEGGPQLPSTRQYSFAFIGKHITADMRDDIVDCYAAYRTAISEL